MSEHNEAHVAQPSVWPATLALGVTLLLFGLITAPAIVAAGVGLIIWATAGWVGELRHG
jgi:hypothetical protein